MRCSRTDCGEVRALRGIEAFVPLKKTPIAVFIQKRRFCWRLRHFIFTRTNQVNLLNVCLI